MMQYRGYPDGCAIPSVYDADMSSALSPTLKVGHSVRRYTAKDIKRASIFMAAIISYFILVFTISIKWTKILQCCKIVILMDLFDDKNDFLKMPLAKRMCPVNLDEFTGQNHILEKGKLLRRSIESDRVFSIILYGPPGTGKNALANIIANVTKSRFYELNATTVGIAEVKKIIEEAKMYKDKRTVLFLDEIHRFNKLQQDTLLPHVETGLIILIGATTQNPFFSVNPALISRSLVFQFEPLKSDDIKKILNRAISDEKKGLGKLKIKIDDDAVSHLASYSNGDARKALNSLEIASLTTPSDSNGEIYITRSIAEESIQKRAVIYDSGEDAHYDTISAFIKSMRGSDPDAALYWLAKMIYAGEDPAFIARRIVICASEDVGNADPQALVVANAALSVVLFIGMPEAKIPLAQATVYIASAPKSNASYLAIEEAIKDITEQKTLEVPKHLRDANYKGAKQFGYGKDYKYAHDYENHYVKQEYMPSKKVYYNPTSMGYEAVIKERMEKLKKDKDGFKEDKKQ